MHDIKLIRETPDIFDAGLFRRGMLPQSARILELDANHRATQTRLQEMLKTRNELSAKVGKAKRAGGEVEELVAEVQALKDRIATSEAEDRKLAVEIEQCIAGLPNLPAPDVPDGDDEYDNVELRRVGDPARPDFKPKEHFEIGESLGLMDFETAAKMSGTRFVVLVGALARLERALGAFMLDLHTGEHGYTEIAPPLLVRDSAMYGTGQLPKFSAELFHTLDDF